MSEPLMGMDECSRFLGISKGTLYQWVCQRRLPVVKVGSKNKFRVQDLENWIEQNTRTPDSSFGYKEFVVSKKRDPERCTRAR